MYRRGLRGLEHPLHLASAPPYIILVSAFYLLSSLMTYTLSKTVYSLRLIFQILYKTLWLLQDDSASAAKYIARYVSGKIIKCMQDHTHYYRTYVVSKGAWSKFYMLYIRAST